jgi:hypothetical protein
MQCVSCMIAILSEIIEIQIDVLSSRMTHMLHSIAAARRNNYSIVVSGHLRCDLYFSTSFLILHSSGCKFHFFFYSLYRFHFNNLPMKFLFSVLCSGMMILFIILFEGKFLFLFIILRSHKHFYLFDFFK